MSSPSGTAEVRAPRLVLASASPRRSDILRMLGLEFDVDPAHIPEDRQPKEPPAAFVARLAGEKAAVVAARNPDALVLGGDTVVAIDEALLEKPTSAADAVRMLMTLAGRTHSVFTGIAISEPGGALRQRADEARVRFRSFDEAEARDYVETGEPMDKAGAYGIQSKGAALVAGVEGDFYTVMGLSVHGLVSLLAECGWQYRYGQLVPGEMDRIGGPGR